MNAAPFFAFFQNLQGWELLIIFFVILLLFGAKKLPELARGVGKAIREFKSAAQNAEDSIQEAMNTPPPAKPQAHDNESTTTKV